MQVSPRIWNVAVPRPQHSPMFGQRASSQIVTRPPSRMRFLTSKYCEFALGARTFIHSGRRGRSATGSDLSIAISLETVVPEAPLERNGSGRSRVGRGLVRRQRARHPAGSRATARPLRAFDSEIARFAQLGFNIGILRPGEPNCMYHAEDAQEDFLVLSGECLLIVERQERPLKAWDFVHCPPGRSTSSSVRATVRASSSAPERASQGRGLRYPVDEAALQSRRGCRGGDLRARACLRALRRGQADPLPGGVPERLISRSARP